MSFPLEPSKVVNCGIIGCGEHAQVVHLPTLLFMSQYFKITYLCDISPHALRHSATKVPHGVKTTTDPEELCSSIDVEAVLIVSSDEYHSEYAILALKHNKYVFSEKPLALTRRDTLAIIEAERGSQGKLMVGYMRRFAAPFEDALAEIGSMEKVTYARIRDIIGPNSHFVAQSGTFPKSFPITNPEDVTNKDRKGEEMMKTALEECGGIAVSQSAIMMWRILTGLGCHDLSVMREALGIPLGVVGTSLRIPFWNVLFEFPAFTVCYESGFDNVPRFDAHIEVYSANKVVRVQYDTPYVKGLPVTLHIAENHNGTYRETKIIKSYEDPYTREFKAFYDMVVNGKAVKTTAEDALEDLRIFEMIMRHGFGNNHESVI